VTDGLEEQLLALRWELITLRRMLNHSFWCLEVTQQIIERTEQQADELNRQD
jgi:hypothetical protein